MFFWSKINSGSQRTVIIKKNILWSFLIKGVSILTSFLLVPLTLGYVTAEIYGVWLTISSILHWMTYMDVGFTLGLKNRLAEALAKNDFDRGKGLVSTTYFMMVVIFIPFSILLIVVSPFINWCSILNVSQQHSDTICITIQILSLFLSLQMIVNVFVAVVAAHQKTALSQLFQVIGQVCSLIIIACMSRFVEPSLVNLTFAYSLMPIVIVAFATLFFFRGSMKPIAPNYKSVDKMYIRDLWNLGVKFFIIQVQMIVLYQSTNLLISHIDGPEAVTQYNIAYKLLNIISMVYMIILGPLWPAFTDAYTKGDYNWMKNIYRKMTYFFMALCVVIIVVTFSSPIIYKLWVGEKVSVPFILTLLVALYTALHSWDSLQVMLINGIGAVKIQTYVVLVGIILHIPLSLYLGRFIGILGVIVSMSVINLVYSTVFTIQINKIIHKKAIGIWLK
jgi:O-antigen/teichoic acid export membrane protein